MNGQRAKRLRKQFDKRPNPGRLHGGDPEDQANVKRGDVRVKLGKGRRTTYGWRW